MKRNIAGFLVRALKKIDCALRGFILKFFMPESSEESKPINHESKKEKRGIRFSDLPVFPWLIYVFVRFAAFVISILPLNSASRTAEFLGAISYLILRKRRRIALENLDIAFRDTKSKREKELIARKAFQHIALSFAELFMVKKIGANFTTAIQVTGEDHLKAAHARGRGVIMCMSHFGSWEMLGLYARKNQLPYSVIVRAVRNPFLYEWIQKLRQTNGVQTIDKDGSARKILSELKQGNCVAMLIDQWPGEECVWVDFFGISTATTLAPAVIARRTGAAIVPFFCRRLSYGKYAIEYLPEVVVPQTEHWQEAVMTTLSKQLEGYLRKFPEQWIWGHRRWKQIGPS